MSSVDIQAKNIQLPMCEVCGGPLNNRTLKNVPIFENKKFEIKNDGKGLPKFETRRVITGYKKAMNMGQYIRFCSKNCRRQRHRRDVVTTVNGPKMTEVFKARVES